MLYALIMDECVDACMHAIMFTCTHACIHAVPIPCPTLVLESCNITGTVIATPPSPAAADGEAGGGAGRLRCTVRGDTVFHDDAMGMLALRTISPDGAGSEGSCALPGGGMAQVVVAGEAGQVDGDAVTRAAAADAEEKNLEHDSAGRDPAKAEVFDADKSAARKRASERQKLWAQAMAVCPGGTLTQRRNHRRRKKLALQALSLGNGMSELGSGGGGGGGGRATEREQEMEAGGGREGFGWHEGAELGSRPAGVFVCRHVCVCVCVSARTRVSD